MVVLTPVGFNELKNLRRRATIEEYHQVLKEAKVDRVMF